MVLPPESSSEDSDVSVNSQHHQPPPYPGKLPMRTMRQTNNASSSSSDSESDSTGEGQVFANSSWQSESDTGPEGELHYRCVVCKG